MLAERYGTPLFVYDSHALTGALRALRAALHPAVEVSHSLRANPNISVVGLLAGHGAATEVSSLVELRTAVLADVDPHAITFLSPSKSREELHACVASRVYAVVAESFDELAELDRIAAAQAVRQRVLVRVDPRASGRSDERPEHGTFRPSGMDVARLARAAALPDRYPALDVAGVHVSLTSGPDPDAVVDDTARSLELAERVAAATQIRLDAVQLGGGLDAACVNGYADVDVARLAGGMARVVGSFRTGYPHTRLLFEAGRFLTARAGLYIVRVRHVGESLGQRFAVVDGATHQHLAGATHQDVAGATHQDPAGRPTAAAALRDHPVRLLNRPGTGPAGAWHLICPLCTPGDTVRTGVALHPLRAGDLLGFECCGASGPTASATLFLRHGIPAEVLVHQGEAYLIRDREEPSDLLRKQRHHRLAGDNLDRVQVVEQIRATTAQLLGRELPALTEETSLTELGLDSTGVLEMLMSLEQHASFEVDADELDPAVFVTVGSLADYVMRIRRGR
jgi:diaminopimelate decarboxylase